MDPFKIGLNEELLHYKVPHPFTGLITGNKPRNKNNRQLFNCIILPGNQNVDKTYEICRWIVNREKIFLNLKTIYCYGQMQPKLMQFQTANPEVKYMRIYKSESDWSLLS